MAKLNFGRWGTEDGIPGVCESTQDGIGEPADIAAATRNVAPKPRCTCDDFCDSHCRIHHYGELECECGHRFAAPLSPTKYDTATCPVCDRWYVGAEDAAGGHWEHNGYRTRAK